MWHWGNIGSFLAGLSTVVIAIAALIRGPEAVREWITRQRAQAEAAREEAENIRLERRAHLQGWSANGVNSYPVTLVTESAEIDLARHQLASGDPSAYIVLRISETADGGSVNMADNLRQRIQREGYVARPTTAGKVEALRAGLDAMGITHANY